ncbi:MAG: dTDP-4-dehydrorhamnose reductase, partial [Rhodocyclaceae bacterium]|nr:dTDP-4-dehydrorhamnose reductase [Rhodocyclaceae bacterium]
REEGDLADPAALAVRVRDFAPAVIVNAGAYTAVDKAESEAELATAVNAEAPAALARVAAEQGAWLVHYSTDYVFDGSRTGAYREDEATNPLSVYGRSKWQGEEGIRSAGGRHLIFRTSWVFGARGGNFLKTMLRLAGEREQLRVVADQVGAPTGAELLADVTAHCLRDALRPGGEELSGTYHLTAGGAVSWHGYARHVVERALAAGRPLRCRPEDVVPITTAEYPLPAPRPANSCLDTSRLRERFGLSLPDWRVGVDRVLDEILS